MEHTGPGVLSLFLKFLNHLLPTSDICFSGLTVHSNLICWCSEYLVLFVLCCVNVNVRRFWAQAGAHSLQVLARLMPKLVASGCYVLDSGTCIAVTWHYRDTFYLFLELFSKWLVQCPSGLALVLWWAVTGVCKNKSVWAASCLNWGIMRLLGRVAL